jgi:baculoviral IAP repeat-containing protein 7/8
MGVFEEEMGGILPKYLFNFYKLNYEIDRYRTFDQWTNKYINTRHLARAGFYYVGPGDLVKCYFCGVEINKWEFGDNIKYIHIKWNPCCPLMCKYTTNNKPIDVENTIL